MTLAWSLLSSTAGRSASAFSIVSQKNVGLQRSSNVKRIASIGTRMFATATEEEVAAEEDIMDAADSSIYTRDAESLSKLKSPFLTTLRDRGFLHQCSNLLDLDEKLMKNSGKNEGEALAAYLGFDATADSLHVGSLLQIMILRHLQKSGHRPIVLIGGGTSKVGDPTGKDESRVLLTDEVILQNTQGISKVFEKFLNFAGKQEDASDASDAIMVNNNDWLSQLSYLDFLREYGTQFTINRMMSFESVKQRLNREAPFSFLEFNYMILQAYDFLELHRRYGATLQLGGSDQWGNMISGVDLGRRCDGAKLYALTAPLLTTSDGKKMGKTEGGAIWLNEDRLSSFDYWQFWRNTNDDDTIKFLKLFTELPLEEIEKMEDWKGADINKAKIVLADEATSMLHGKECLKTIHETVETMFKGGGAKGKVESTEGLPRIYVTQDELSPEGVRFPDLFLKLGLATSKKDARRLIQGGGARLEGEKITDENASLTIDDFEGGEKQEVTLRAGKKRAGVVELQ
eukprot:CAMPEP_0185733606 /NCGR_PEP_ID=MMETSP1171-20130828/20101_1 /TAXON_ID=374046 /ORGANISM="Helicotheca tamensis, Strain CCMP826" /LENGTH=514 /DNA_ID=CAMNT_0028403383 /DNA_START=106 /DNA_END=1650 /DNA_ORIENTATION=+